MFTRTAFGLAVILATASGALAAPKYHATAPVQQQNVYNPYGALSTDPDPGVRFEIIRDWSHGRG